MYTAEIESRVAGIPCIIGVLSFDSVRGSYSYTESEWEVLDRRGRKALWLERKLSDKDCNRIEQEIAEYFNG